MLEFKLDLELKKKYYKFLSIFNLYIHFKLSNLKYKINKNNIMINNIIKIRMKKKKHSQFIKSKKLKINFFHH